jgi:SAM-dependent methyltransferase
MLQDGYSRRRIKRYNTVKQMASKYNFASYLDVGCGTGEFAKSLNISVTHGIDMDYHVFNIAKKNLIFKHWDFNEYGLPYPDSNFDLVTCLEVLEHIPKTDEVIAEIYRVLIPGGILILSTPNLNCWYNRILIGIGKCPAFYEVSYKKHYGTFNKNLPKPVGHCRLFPSVSLIEFLKDNKFSIISTTGISVGENKIVGFFDDFISPLNFHLASDLVVVAKKI